MVYGVKRKENSSNIIEQYNLLKTMLETTKVQFLKNR